MKELKKEMNNTCEHLKKQVFLLNDSNKKLQQEKNDMINEIIEKKENIMQIERLLEDVN